MDDQCESTVLTADGEDIVQCARPDTHAGRLRNWDKIKAELPVEWKTGQEVATTSIRVPETEEHVVTAEEMNKTIEGRSGQFKIGDTVTIYEPTDVMVPVAVYEGMVDALQRIAKGPDRFGGYGPSPDGNQTPAKIAKAALEGVDVEE